MFHWTLKGSEYWCEVPGMLLVLAFNPNDPEDINENQEGEWWLSIRLHHDTHECGTEFLLESDLAKAQLYAIDYATAMIRNCIVSYTNTLNVLVD